MSSVTTDREGRSAKAAGRTDVPCADWLGRCRPGSRVLRSPLPHPFPSRSRWESSASTNRLVRGGCRTPPRRGEHPPTRSPGWRVPPAGVSRLGRLLASDSRALPLTSSPPSALVWAFQPSPFLPYLQPQALADGQTFSPFLRMEGLRRSLGAVGARPGAWRRGTVVSLFLASIPASRSQRLHR